MRLILSVWYTTGYTRRDRNAGLRWWSVVVQQGEVITAYRVRRLKKGKFWMAAITIPESVKGYFPETIDPAQLWVNYNPHADSLTVYFTENAVPSVWEDIDDYL